MKRIKIKFFVTLVLLFISSGIYLVNSQDYSYPDELTVDATYDWEVLELVVSGTIDTPYLDFGDDRLDQGDTISVKIIQNVNNVTNGTPSELLEEDNIWAEFYLNDEFKTNITDEIGLIRLDWLDFEDLDIDIDFFIQPTTYENQTGSYNFFEILQNNFQQISVDKTEESETYDTYEYTKTRIIQSSKLTSKSWTLKVERNIDEKVENLVEPWQKELTKTIEKIEIRFNVDTGILSYINYDFSEHYEREIDGSLDIDDDIVKLHIESTSVPVGAPFNWAFSLFGLFIIGLVVYRKRKN